MRADLVHPAFPINGEIAVGSRMYTSLGPSREVINDGIYHRDMKSENTCSNDIAVLAVEVLDVMMSFPSPSDVCHP